MTGRRRYFSGITILCLIGTIETAAHGTPVCINEFMANNVQTIADMDGEFNDWIELYNSSVDSIDLEGFGLSDDLEDPFKWIFPHVVLPGGHILIIFASGKDQKDWPGELHSNFKISASGENLLLTSPLNDLIDHVPPVHLLPDVSYGRCPDGHEESFFFDVATPGESNGDDPPLEHAAMPEFSLEPGYYESGTLLELHCNQPGAAIRYTCDGSVPTNSSTKYEEYIELSDITVIRAVSFADGFLPSHPLSGTFLVSFSSELPVVSLIAEPVQLWSDEQGIYVQGPNADPESPHTGANFWQDWEIPAHIDYFPTETIHELGMTVGLAIHGGWTRVFPQKSLRLTARDSYGNDRIPCQFFPWLPITEFKSVLLRNSGNDWQSTMMRDALMGDLATGLDIGIQDYQPVVVLLNGDYWGIHNLREHMNEHYLEDHYGVDRDNLDVIKCHRIAMSGDLETYNALTTLVESADMTDSACYDSVQSMMNIADFIRYQAAEIFYANKDWPANNIKCWRPRCPGGRFRWLLYDTDNGFSLSGPMDHNTLEYATAENSDYWANPPHATLLLRKLLQNADFRERFIVEFSHLLNTTFHPDRILGRIQTLTSVIEPEMPSHIDRWYPGHNWDAELVTLKQFAIERQGYVREHIRVKFDLGDQITLTLECDDDVGGRIKIGTFSVDTNPWQGIYFQDLPIILRAEPFVGYRFAGWSGGSCSTDEEIDLTPWEDLTIHAHFERVENPVTDLVITEINYNSHEDFDPGDWIEIYVLNGSHDISGWQLRDSNDGHVYQFPDGTMALQGDYLIASSDPDAFTELFPDVPRIFGPLGFDLSADGDQIRLYSLADSQVDSIHYFDHPPWPIQADGHGSTLQLLNPSVPNEFPENWRASSMSHGDPGSGDYVPLEGSSSSGIVPDIFRIISISPNPVQCRATILTQVPSAAHVLLRLYDLQGRIVHTPVDRIIPTGEYRFPLEVTPLASGTYVLRASSENRILGSERVMVIK